MRYGKPFLGMLVMFSAGLWGCSNENVENIGSGAAPVEHEALDTFEQNGVMELGYAAERGDWNAVKNSAGSDQFKSAVSAFESAPLPEELSDRKAEKDAVVAAAKSLEEKASGSKDEVQAAYKALTDAVAKLRAQ